MKKVNIKDKYITAGIYKINYPNGKVYIGQSQNIFKRIEEHNTYAFQRHGNRQLSPCELAIQKYGKISEFEILYETDDFTTLDEQETYWIQYYDATNKEKGYNIIKKGNASGKRGVENCFASFDEQTLSEVIDLLVNHKEISIKDIAFRYQVNPMTIIDISKGRSYVNPQLNYPLRNNDHSSNIKILTDYFKNEEELLAFKDSLKYDWDLSMEEDIPKKWNIPRERCKDINAGRIFSEYGEYTYPIRQKNIRNNHNFSKEIVKNILYELKETHLSMSKIGERYGVGRASISSINKGEAYIIKGYDYPARITK